MFRQCFARATMRDAAAIAERGRRLVVVQAPVGFGKLETARELEARSRASVFGPRVHVVAHGRDLARWASQGAFARGAALASHARWQLAAAAAVLAAAYALERRVRRAPLCCEAGQSLVAVGAALALARVLLRRRVLVVCARGLGRAKFESAVAYAARRDAVVVLTANEAAGVLRGAAGEVVRLQLPPRYAPTVGTGVLPTLLDGSSWLAGEPVAVRDALWRQALADDDALGVSDEPVLSATDAALLAALVRAEPGAVLPPLVPRGLAVATALVNSLPPRVAALLERIRSGEPGMDATAAEEDVAAAEEAQRLLALQAQLRHAPCEAAAPLRRAVDRELRGVDAPTLRQWLFDAATRKSQQ